MDLLMGLEGKGQTGSAGLEGRRRGWCLERQLMVYFDGELCLKSIIFNDIH